MIKNTAIAIFISLLLGNSTFGQADVLNNAINALTNGNLSTAKEQIDLAVSHTETANLAQTWYYRFYIYKEIYKTKEQNNRFSLARDEAIFSLENFIKTTDKEPFEASVQNSSKFLISSYYNNAVTDLRNGYFEFALTNYEKYKENYSLIDATKKFGEEDIKFQLALANGLMNLYESNRTQNENYYKKAKNVYSNIIKTNPTNWNANYNIGILIYNRAVSIIKSMDYGTDLYKVDELQAECVKLFFTALPYMKKAHELNPIMNEPIAGLTGIYYSLHEEEQYFIYKNMLNNNRH